MAEKLTESQTYRTQFDRIMLETMLGYIVDDCCPMEVTLLPSMTVNQDSKTPYTDATQVVINFKPFKFETCRLLAMYYDAKTCS